MPSPGARGRAAMFCRNMCRCLFPPGAVCVGGAFQSVCVRTSSHIWGVLCASPCGTQSSSKSTFPIGTRLVSRLLQPWLGGTPLLTWRKRTPWQRRGHCKVQGTQVVSGRAGDSKASFSDSETQYRLSQSEMDEWAKRGVTDADLHLGTAHLARGILFPRTRSRKPRFLFLSRNLWWRFRNSQVCDLLPAVPQLYPRPA